MKTKQRSAAKRTEKRDAGGIRADAVDAIVRAAMEAAQAPGAAIAIVSGDDFYVQGYGVKTRGEDDSVTPDTLFAVGSTTKAFTTIAMAILADENKMDWDDPVRKHLPAFRLSDPLADAHVTLRDLVCHRTGLPRHDMLWYGSPWNRDEVLRRIGFAPLTASFRSLYQYQNICFLAAGEAVARASGADSFEAFVRERLLLPLGMDGANFSTRDAEADADRATPHRDLKHRREILPWRNLDNIGPAGSINAGASDMARWVRFQLAGGVAPDGTRLVSEKNLRETHTPQMVVPMDDDTRALYPDTTQTSYGLGWVISDYRGGHRLVQHGGAIGGFRANVALLPEIGAGVAVLCNMQSFLPEMVRNAVLDHLLGLPAHDWNAAFNAHLKTAEDRQKKREKERKAKRHKKTTPSRELSAYAGDYENPAYGTATITKKGSALHLAWSNWTSKIKHHHFDTFTTDTKEPAIENEDLVFTMNADGDIASLTLFETTFTKTPPQKAAAK